MLNKTDLRFAFFYALILTIHLFCGINKSFEDFTYISKPAIVFSLGIYFWFKSKSLPTPLRFLTILALLFSLIGDIALMFDSIDPIYFILGLASFLLAHVMYILTFLKHRNTKKNPIGFMTILLLYALALFYLLKNNLGDLLLPVIIYMLVILGMSSTAYLRQNMVNKTSFYWVFVGAILFMVSDSILALNKFYQPLPLSTVSIMLSYALAQFCIISGILKLNTDSN